MVTFLSQKKQIRHAQPLIPFTKLTNPPSFLHRDGRLLSGSKVDKYVGFTKTEHYTGYQIQSGMYSMINIKNYSVWLLWNMFTVQFFTSTEGIRHFCKRLCFFSLWHFSHSWRNSVLSSSLGFFAGAAAPVMAQG